MCGKAGWKTEKSAKLLRFGGKSAVKAAYKFYWQVKYNIRKKMHNSK
jgi:hypothetical protein